MNNTSGALNPGIACYGSTTTPSITFATYGNGGLSNTGGTFTTCAAVQYLAVGATGVNVSNWAGNGAGGTATGVNLNGVGIQFASAVGSANDTNISRLGAGVIGLGSGTAASVAGTLYCAAIGGT